MSGTELATTVVRKTTSESEAEEGLVKNPAAVALGRLGGRKGGPARARKLTAAQRSEIAKKAARTRWQKPRKVED